METDSTANILTATKALAFFLQTVGDAENQLENIRLQLYLEKHFSLVGAFELLDTHRKTFITKSDIILFMSSQSSFITDAEADIIFEQLCAPSSTLQKITVQKTMLKLEDLMSTLLSSKEPVVRDIMNRNPDALAANAYARESVSRLMAGFFKQILTNSKAIDAARISLKYFPKDQLFSLMDVDSKGRIDYSSIRSFFRLSAPATGIRDDDDEMSNGIHLYLQKNSLPLPLIYSTFLRFTTPHVKYVQQTLYSSKEETETKWEENSRKREELLENQRVRSQIMAQLIQRNRSIEENVKARNSPLKRENSRTRSESGESRRKSTEKEEGLKPSRFKPNSTEREFYLSKARDILSKEGDQNTGELAIVRKLLENTTEELMEERRKRMQLEDTLLTYKSRVEALESKMDRITLKELENSNLKASIFKSDRNTWSVQKLNMILQDQNNDTPVNSLTRKRSVEAMKGVPHYRSTYYRETTTPAPTNLYANTVLNRSREITRQFQNLKLKINSRGFR